MTTYELYRKRYKELYITVQKDGIPYKAAGSEKIRFVIFDASSSAVLLKELTAENYDDDLKKYKLILSSNTDMDIPAGRYFFNCDFVDSHGEKTRISSGRVIVRNAFIYNEVSL